MVFSEIKKSPSTACNFCGQEGSHSSSCPLVSKEELYKEVSVAEVITEQDLRELFVSGRKLSYPRSEDVGPGWVEGKVEDYNQHPGLHYFVLKLQGGIIGFAQFEEIRADGQKKALFHNHYISPQWQNKGLSHFLDRARIEKATTLKCSEAYTVVFPGNIGSLRSLTREGFVINDKPNNEFIERADPKHFFGTYFYLSRPLEERAEAETGKFDPAVLKNVKLERSFLRSKAEWILIYCWEDYLVKQALKQGYVGRQLILPKDFQEENPLITEEAILLQKVN